MISSSRKPSTVRNPLRYSVLASVCLVGLLMSASCRRRSNGTPKQGQTKEAQCVQMLENALDMAQPLSLGPRNNVKDATDRLNDWQQSCPEMQKISTKIHEDSRKLLAGLLKEKEVQEMQRETYDDRDVRHLRNSIVFSRIADFSVAAETEIGQVVELFYYVIRNVQLVELKPESAPRPVFRVLLFGQGNARDRAWVFAALLRQLKFPAVILSSSSGKKDANESGAPFLVGVLMDKQILLFDTRLGLPIPAPDDDRSNPLIRKPATLRQFVEDKRVVESLQADDFPYPLKSADLKTPRVQLIGHRALWAGRNKRLFHTIGTSKTKLYVELGGKQGLLATTLEFGTGRFGRENISLWPYPERTISRFADMTDAQQAEMIELQRPFGAPREVVMGKDPKDGKKKPVIDKNGNPQLGADSHLQLKARVRQLTGEFDKAVTSFVSVRSQCRTTRELYPLAPQQQKMLAIADQDADFWISCCKYELGDLSTADERLGRIAISRPPRKWTIQANYLQAVIAARNGKPGIARTLMVDLIKLKSPQSHGFALLRKRWKSLRPAKINPRKKDPPESPQNKKRTK